MATTTVQAYLENKRTQIAAITDGGPLAFNLVRILPTDDIDNVLRLPRWPQAVIVDKGGTIDPLNGKVWDRIMSVTIFVMMPRDPAGEKAVEELLRKGDILTSSLEYDETDSAIFLIADSDFEAVEFEEGAIVVSKSYHFRYSIERV